MSENTEGRGNRERERQETIRELYEQVERDMPSRETFIRIEDIRLLVRDGEYVFTLAQLLTPEQRTELDRYWLAQPPDAVERATAAIERLYHDTLGCKRPSFDAKITAFKIIRKRS